MDIKQKFAIGTAVVAFAVGWGLTIAGFVLPPEGEVHDSVLWILGQALVYTRPSWASVCTSKTRWRNSVPTHGSTSMRN